MLQQPESPSREESLAQKGVHLVIGLAALLVLGCVGLVVLTWGAKELGVLPEPSRTVGQSHSETDARWDRIEATLQQHEAKWQDAALAELRNTIPIYAGGLAPAFEACTVLGRTEDGEHLIAEAIWFDKQLPAGVSPRVSSIALIQDRGGNKPRVVQLTSCPRKPTLTAARVRDFAGLVPGANWTFGNF